MFFKDDEENLEDMLPMGGGQAAPVDDLAAPAPEMAGPADDIERKAATNHVIKSLLSGVGGVMQSQANVPSAFEMLYGKRSPRADFQGTADRAAAMIQDPMEQKKKAFEYLKAKRDSEQLAKSDAPASPEMIQFYEGVVPSMRGKFNGMTGAQLEKISPVLMAKFRAEGDERMARAAAGERAAAKADAKAEKLELDKKERTTAYGVARTADDAKQIKSASDLKAAFDEKLSEMIALREKHKGGAVLNREDVGRGKALANDLLLAYKDLSKLGVMSKTDENILRSIIPSDPLQYNSPAAWLQGQDPTMNQMKKFKDDTEKDFQARLKNRIEDYKSPAPADGGMVSVRAPDGRVKRIPKSQVDAALAAGGTLFDPSTTAGR